jgi:type VI secretion system secreted protein VgrG
MAPFNQQNRPLQVTTPLPENSLLITGFRGTEELSTLFRFQLDLIAQTSTSIDFSKVIGGEITVKIAAPDKSGNTAWRFIN